MNREESPIGTARKLVANVTIDQTAQHPAFMAVRLSGKCTVLSRIAYLILLAL